MDLFSGNTESNLLPHGGEVFYYGHVMPRESADRYFFQLMQNIEWKNDESMIMGKLIVTKRKVAWYGEKPFSYTYSGTTKTALPFTQELVELKKIAEQTTGATYNSCLLNLYHHGDEGMAWHSDAEKMLLKHGSIASVSLGAERKFSFRHKRTDEKIELVLQHGSLLEMKGETQENWLHRLPPSVKIKTPRVNLTFRTIVS